VQVSLAELGAEVGNHAQIEQLLEQQVEELIEEVERERVAAPTDPMTQPLGPSLHGVYRPLRWHNTSSLTLSHLKRRRTSKAARRFHGVRAACHSRDMPDAMKHRTAALEGRRFFAMRSE
jgi:hypothetical protein